MKKLNFFVAIVLLFAAPNFISCSSDVEPIDPAIIIPTDPEPNPDAGVFKVDIDGQTYTAATTMVYMTGGAIQISATRAQGDNFGILLGGTIAGNYPANDNLIAYTPPGSEYGWWSFHPTDDTANTGSLVITSIDTENHRISGTFSYTGYWSDDTVTNIPVKQFTNGVFTDLPYVSSSPTNDVFLAKVNGVDFNQNDLLVATVEINGQEFIAIGATNAADNSLSVNVKSSVGVGTYPITGSLATDSVQINYALNVDDSGVYATSGQVVVTEKTATRIKGTFTGSVVIEGATYAISAGSFDVEY
jgi:hypothetical protein